MIFFVSNPLLASLSWLHQSLYRFDRGWHTTFLLQILKIHYQSCFIGLQSFYVVCIIMNQIMDNVLRKFKVVSSDILMIKKIVDPLSLSSLPQKLIYCFKLAFPNPIFLALVCCNQFLMLSKIFKIHQITYCIGNNFFERLFFIS